MVWGIFRRREGRPADENASDAPEIPFRPSILWSIRAQLGKLRNRAYSPPDEAPPMSDDDIARLLAKTFDGHHLIIHDVLGGFSVKPEREILHVEVCGDPHGRAERSYIVKVGLVTKLKPELVSPDISWCEQRLT